MPRTFSVAALLAGLALAAGPVRAADDDKVLGSDGCCHTDARAGYPREISCLARVANTWEYFGYYVGGGCLFQRKGGDSGPLQGTYGWDYGGHACGVKPKIVLNFCYGCRYKGGIGAYETDKGPHILNVFGLKLPKRDDEVPTDLKCNGPNCAGRETR